MKKLLFALLAFQACTVFAKKTIVPTELFDKFARYAQFSSAAQRQPCQNLPSGSKIPCKGYINENSTSTQATIFRDDTSKEFILVFQGLDPDTPFSTDIAIARDLITAIEVDQVPYVPPFLSCPGCTVHRGFYKSWLSIQNQIVQTLRQDSLGYNYSFVIVGHSLGGALAQLAFATLHGQGFEISSVYTFGQPRVGNSAFADHVDCLAGAKIPLELGGHRLIRRDNSVQRRGRSFNYGDNPCRAAPSQQYTYAPGRYYRVTHAADPIPRISFRTNISIGNYRHVSTEYWIAAKTTYQDASTTYRCVGQEPKDCTNSQPFKPLLFKFRAYHVAYANTDFENSICDAPTGGCVDCLETCPSACTRDLDCPTNMVCYDGECREPLYCINPTAVGTELLQNTGFEDSSSSIEPWTPAYPDTFFEVRSPGFNSPNALYCAYTDDDTCDFLQSFEMCEGALYEFSMDIFVEASTGKAKSWVYLVPYGDTTGYFAQRIAFSGKWTHMRLWFSGLQSGSRMFEVWARRFSGKVKGYYLDNMRLKRVTPNFPTKSNSPEYLNDGGFETGELSPHWYFFESLGNWSITSPGIDSNYGVKFSGLKDQYPSNIHSEWINGLTEGNIYVLNFSGRKLDELAILPTVKIGDIDYRLPFKTDPGTGSDFKFSLPFQAPNDIIPNNLVALTFYFEKNSSVLLDNISIKEAA